MVSDDAETPSLWQFLLSGASDVSTPFRPVDFFRFLP
jgi:hypothetical protein